MALPYPTLPGDIDHLIADDHAVVERQFQHLEARRGDRRVLVDQVAFELALHADAEERVLYPAMAEAGEAYEAEDSRKDHQQVKELLVTLQNTDPGEPEFEDALANLIGSVRRHVAEEEGEFLPAFRRAVGPQRLAELGKEFLAAKRAVPTYAHPNAPSGETGHKLLDAGAKAVDMVRDKATGRMKHLATDPSGALDPQAQRILDAFAAMEPQPFEILEPDQARRQPTPADAVRKVLEDDGRPTDPEPVASVQDMSIDGPGGRIGVRVYTPEGAGGGPLPIVLWIHGGGWVLFTVDTYDASCRGIANRTGAIVVSPEYRRAPEHVFPAAHDDVLATYRWVRDNAEALGGDPARIAIGGESVGGNMAAATCLQLAAMGEPLPTAQVLVYPLTTGEQFGDSMVDAADARPLNRPLLSWMAMHAFEGVPDAGSDPRVNLLSVPTDRLAGMPPTLVITDERDPLRDQGEEFARHLEQAGVPVTASRYDGVMHEFFGAAAVLDKAAQAQTEAAEHLRRSFTAPAAAH
ncbi:alpha/beta hydrolase fold domain-containing protein [Pseudonocardia nigra]|uniref:alpha/beta hydrolase fold domain-containing protein n=1 Tax=Pseudonocardia nigra TaxID=1921578 RepID=UPI001C5F7371|nr:alpha/beta hydrolase fold domain-containing protein [Pseudonocardia nigra]